MGEAEDKAEKLAAAKKKYEQLKKQKAKKGGAAKKKEDAESSAAKEVEDAKKEVEEAKEKEKEQEEDAAEAVEDDGGAADEAADTIESPKKESHGRTPSVSVQSKLRSESFRKESPRSPAGDGDPAFKIEELERENKKLAGEKEEAEKRWKKLEEELQELKEAEGDSGGWLKQADGQAAEVEKLKAEITSLQRQNAQLTSSAKRKSSASVSLPSPSPTANSDLLVQLNSKSETISSLELELSTLQSKLSTLQSQTDAQDSKLSSLELDLAKAIHDKESVAQELADLKANLERASERAVADGSARSSAETKVAQLKAELGSAKRAAEEAKKRADTQEKKVATLTTLHRESDARHQTKLADLGKSERDAKELRARVTALSNENARLTDEAIRRKKLEASGDSEGLEELEDEERQRLTTKVRELEEEIFELRRGVWREKRMQLQPGMDISNDPYGSNTTFDDIDLSPSAARRTQQQHSTFSDVINSGLAAFRGDQGASGNNRRQSVVGGRDRGQSLGLMSDDGFEFDEDAFRKAQENDQKARLERIKETKRGLSKWKGWRIDIADVRGGWGGVFEA